MAFSYKLCAMAWKWLKHLWWKDVAQDPQYAEVQISCAEITLTSIDQTLYDKLLLEAEAAGAKFDGTKASISGCEFDWSYDADSQTLHVTCLKKPFFISCDQVEQKIRELVNGAKDVVG